MKEQRYTVFNVPWYLQPFFQIYSYGIAILFKLHLLFNFWTCKFEFVGEELLEEHPSHIISSWHEDLTLYFSSFPNAKTKQIWMTYDLWYMRPIHILKNWAGIEELAYGSSERGGREALLTVISRLKDGWCTFISPDGPAGPLKKAKSGVLQMSLQSGRPIIPVSIETSREWRANTWDRKRQLYPFSHLTMTFHEPVFVTEANYEESRRLIETNMSFRKMTKN